jgi:hypothetical protein
VRALGRLLSMRDSAARSETHSRSREWRVLQSQGCGFSLFSSCSALLSRAKSGGPGAAAGAHFSFSSRSLREDQRRRVVAGRLFFSCYLQGNTGPRASPSHVADAAVHHYLYAVSAGLA